jgi:hypothetical protein
VIETQLKLPRVIYRQIKILASSPTMRSEMLVDISYAAPQAHGIVNVGLHREYSAGIIFIFFQERKNLYHV